MMTAVSERLWQNSRDTDGNPSYRWSLVRGALPRPVVFHEKVGYFADQRYSRATGNDNRMIAFLVSQDFYAPPFLA